MSKLHGVYAYIIFFKWQLFILFSFDWSKLLRDLKYVRGHILLVSSWLFLFKINCSTIILGHILLDQILPQCSTAKWRACNFYNFPSKEIWQEHHSFFHYTTQWRTVYCVVSFNCTVTNINIVQSEEVILSEKSQLFTSTLASFKLMLVIRKIKKPKLAICQLSVKNGE